MDDILKYYEILGLKPGATEKEIKQAYRDLAKVWHPDRFTGSPRLQEKAQEKLKEINLAYDYLKSHRYTPPEEEPYDFGREEYQQEEDPPQEDKAERKEQTTTYTPTYKQDSFFSKIPKWFMVVIALVLVRALFSYLNAPSKPQKTEYKPPLYYPLPSKPLLPPIDSPHATEKQKLKEPITKPLMKPFPPKTAKSSPSPVQELQKPSSKALDAPLKEEALKETTDTSQPSEKDLKYADVKEQIKRIEKKLEVVKKNVSSEPPDKVATLPPPQPITAGKYFTFGSSKEEVLAVQGTPTSIVGETWYYNHSSISFSNGRVRGYSDTSKNLHVKMSPQADSESRRSGDYFTLGSTKDDVLAIQGTPSSIVGETWYYNHSSISFVNGRVGGYSNTSRNLRVAILPKPEFSGGIKGYFTMGSTHDEVLAVQGTPSGIVGDTWYYNHSSVSFSNGRVRGYSDTSHNLKVKLEYQNHLEKEKGGSRIPAPWFLVLLGLGVLFKP